MWMDGCVPGPKALRISYPHWLHPFPTQDVDESKLCGHSIRFDQYTREEDGTFQPSPPHM